MLVLSIISRKISLCVSFVPGHVAASCFLLRDILLGKTHNSSSSEPSSIIVSNVETPTNKWIINFGVGHHLTPNENNFPNYIAYDKYVGILVFNGDQLPISYCWFWYFPC